MKKMRKSLLCLLMVSLLLTGMLAAQAAWDGTAASAFYSGTGTESNPYIVRTEKHLAYFVNQLKAGNTFEGQYISLKASLNMTGGTWDAGTTDFAGTFLGNGYTITLNSRFVYKIAEGGMVDWLYLKATETLTDSLLCEYNNGTIQNCRVEGDVFNDPGDSTLLCFTNNGTILNSCGFGTLEGHGDDSDCWVGWIGKNNGTVKDCYTILTLSGSAPGKYNSLYKNGIAAVGSNENCYTGDAVLANDAEFVRLLNQSLSIPGYIWAEDTGNINGGYPIIKKCLSATVGLADIDAPMFTYHSSSLTTSISCDTSGCTIYYTLDGSDPVTSSTRKTYNGSLTVRGDVPITMVAYKNGEYGIPKSQYAVYLPGEGTEDDPYQITTELQLCAVYLEPDAYYELGADLDFTDGGCVYEGIESIEWTPIESFSGRLDGNSHSITGLKSSNGGLIDSNTGTICDLRLINHQLCLWANTRDRVYSFGPLAHGSSGLITRCYVSGSTGATVTNTSVGGIVGYNSGTISYCYSSGTLTTDGLDSYAWFEMGGIAGENRGTIRSCYSDASLYGDQTSHDLGTTAGGIAYGGYVYDSRFDGYIKLNAGSASFGVGAAASHGDRASSYRCYNGGATFTTVYSGTYRYHTQETDLYKATGTGKDYMEKAFPAFDFNNTWMITDDGPMPQGIMQPDGKIYTKYSYQAPTIGREGYTECTNGTTFVLPASDIEMGTHGNLYWERTAEGALTITGKGEMTGDDIWDFPWYVDPVTDDIIAQDITSVSIGSGVTTIAPYAFYKCGATTVTLPDTLVSIGNYAFDRSAVVSLTLPSSLKSIDYGVFYNRNLTLTFTGDAPTFSTGAFHGATVTVHYPANSTTWSLDMQQNYGGKTVTWIRDGQCSHKSAWCTLENKVDADCTNSGHSGDTVCSLCGEIVQAGSILPALGHRVHSESEYPLTITNNSAVPFVVDSDRYYSNNHTNSSTSQIIATADSACTLTLHYGVSSEANYDKLYILHNSTQKDMISGIVAEKTLTLELKAGDTITVRYTKDGSQNHNDDRGWVSFGSAEMDIPAEEVEPTCTSGVICTYCQTVVKEALPHTMAVDEAVPPTCVATGLTEGSHCEVCGEVLLAQEIVPATGRHQYDLDESVDPTCTASGLTVGSSCHVCGFVHLAQEVVPATGHTEVPLTAVPPTCTEMGLTEGSMCAVCEEVLLEQETIPELGHTEGPVVEENRIEPTCTEEGSYDEVVYCSVCCTETYRATLSIPYSGHGEEKIVVENEFDPTCIEDGSYDNVTICTVCEVELIRETIAVSKLGHTVVVDPPVESTCTSTGLTEGSHCEVCGEVLKEQKPTQEKNHTVVMDAPKAATCTEPGLKGNGMHCGVCGTVLLAQEEIPALGHEFQDGTCTRCGEGDKAVVYDTASGILILNSLPEGTETAIVAVYSSHGQLIRLVFAEVGEVISDLAFDTGNAVRIFYLDGGFAPVARAYGIQIN